MEDNEYLKHLSIVGKWSPEMSRKYIQVNHTMKENNTNKTRESQKTASCSNEETFINAASVGDLKTLLNLKSKVVVDTQNKKGQTALICATINGHSSAVRFLLAKQAIVEIFDETGNSALHHACLRDDIAVLGLLLNKVNGNYRNKDGQPILHLAIKHEKYQAFDLIINSTKININEQNINGYTALHVAILERNVKVLMKLLILDVDITLYNDEGFNPVNLAIIRDDIEILQLLINSKHGMKILAYKSQFNESNFQIAVREKFSTIVEYLLNLKDNIIVTCDVDDKYGYTCLHWATLQINKELIDKILRSNQKLINVKDMTGKTVLEHIVNIHEKSKSNQNDLLQVAILLISYGANVYDVANNVACQRIIEDICLRFRS